MRVNLGHSELPFLNQDDDRDVRQEVRAVQNLGPQTPLEKAKAKIAWQDWLLDRSAKAIFKLMQKNRELRSGLKRALDMLGSGSGMERSDSPPPRVDFPPATASAAGTSQEPIDLNAAPPSNDVREPTSEEVDAAFTSGDVGGFGDLDSELGLND
jgi:hypothetical protein